MHSPAGFALTSDQCELLTQLRERGSVQRLAELLGRDVSAVNRQLQKIASRGELLQKQNGRWRVSPLGERVVDWTLEAIAAQKKILSARSEIRIVTTREFAARVLAPRLAELTRPEPGLHPILLTSEEGVEPWLLGGRADLGLDCGTPLDPLVRFRGIQPEPFSVVASPAFLSQHLGSAVRARNKLDPERLLGLPHLQYLRRQLRTLLRLECEREPQNIVASFNDIAPLRAACVAGLGWAILPSYTVRTELERQELRSLELSATPNPERFGVWWLREKKSLQPWIDRLARWLAEQNLGAS